MYQASQAFKEAVYAPIRTVKGRVVFDLTDTAIDEDTVTIASTAQSTLSNLDQLTNNVRENSFNLATFENDRFTLDGSFSFADDTISRNGEMGFSSANLCGANRVFENPPTIRFNFGMEHSSAGFTLTFDKMNNEYPTEFDVVAYDVDNEEIWTTEIRGNSSVFIEVYGQFSNYKRIDLVIRAWSLPYRRARVSEVDFGIVREYTDDSLIRMSLIEEVDMTSGTLPKPEFKFTIDNGDRLFNILNPTGFYKYLQKRQNIQADLGVEIDGVVEWVPLGKYLLYEWQSDEGSLTATFTARTNLDVLDTFEYENLTAKTNYNLYRMAADIFAICGISNYQIDTALQNIQTNGIVKKATCTTILQMIAIAAKSHVMVTRDNVIKIVQTDLEIAETTDRIDFDNMYEEPKINLEKIVKSVSVAHFADSETATLETVTDSTVELGDTLVLDTNTLINTPAHALTVANWLLDVSKLRAKYSINWRGNPTHEILDTVEIDNTYSINLRSFITKNELTYEGYLQGKTETKGVVL